jgi:hypothetical protein
MPIDMRSPSFVVKVQLSLHSSTAGRQVLVYNEDQSIHWQDAAGKDIIETMRGRDKAFFNATQNAKGVIEIGEEVEEQGW